jgi:hypothetical protein
VAKNSAVVVCARCGLRVIVARTEKSGTYYEMTADGKRYHYAECIEEIARKRKAVAT